MRLINCGPNKTELVFESPDKSVFFSYETPVAVRVGPTYYRTEEKFSMTTTKHINSWLDGTYATFMPQDFIEKFVSSV